MKSDNTGWCWGGGGNGQLGQGNTTDSNTPVQVSGSWLSITPARWGVTTCGLKTDNTLWCWGYGGYGQLGQGNTSDSTSPVQITGTWSSYAVGFASVCAIKSADSSLWCWGYNGVYQLGDGTTTNRSSPTAVSGGGAWSSVSMGLNGTTSNACGIKTDNSVWCWGYNGFSEGSFNSTGSNGTVPTALNTSTTTTGTKWTSIVAGYGYVCGMRDDSTVYCWGSNAFGRLGDPNYGQYFTPVSGN